MQSLFLNKSRFLEINQQGSSDRSGYYASAGASFIGYNCLWTIDKDQPDWLIYYELCVFLPNLNYGTPISYFKWIPWFIRYSRINKC